MNGIYELSVKRCGGHCALSIYMLSFQKLRRKQRAEDIGVMNDRLAEFSKEIRGKRVAVIGIAVSNTPLIEFLSGHGARITAFDRAGADVLSDRIERLKPCKPEYRLGSDYLSHLKGFEWIFRTPSVRPDIPELVAERGRGAKISSEMELFLELCPSTVFGITGSDGKTTTTTLVYEILQSHGYKCYLGGNIGKPLIADVTAMTATDMAVVELSSFQLMSMEKSVNIAVITNISENHLDIHKSYDEYIAAKKNIFAFQAPDDLCVLNYDNEQTRLLCAETPGRLGLFSRAEDGALRPGGSVAKKPYAAAYVREGRIIYENYSGDAENGKYDGGSVPIIRLEDILIPGGHNVENYLAAICAVYRYADRNDIEATARGFNGVEHRLEYFRTLNGVRYYNDSIASSPTRTIACLNTFDQKIILIAGGKDKKLDYAPLGRYLAEKVKLLILCGQTSERIKQSLLQYCEDEEIACSVPIIECDSYEAAVSAAWKNAKAKDIVVLSPASTSYDRFKNFEERGRMYKELVNALPSM